MCYENQKWHFRFSELGIKADIEKALQEAKEFGKRGTFFQKVEERWTAATSGKKITGPITIEKEKAVSVLEPIAAAIEKKAVNAKYTYHNQKVEIIPNTNGKMLNMDKTLEKLLAKAKAAHGSKFIYQPTS